MSSLRITCVIALALSLAALSGCGGTDEEKRLRGLQTQAEVAVPDSASELNETEAEREKRNVEDLGAAERKNFDQ